MIRFRTLVLSVAAALVLTVGGSVLANSGHVLAAGPQTQAQMMPAQMNPGMGMGMPMGGMLPIFTPAVSNFLGTPSYPMFSPASSYVPQYTPPLSYSSTYTPTYTPPVDLQQVCHQYNVGLQYNTMADDPNLDQICGVTGGSANAASSSTAPSQPAGQTYP